MKKRTLVIAILSIVFVIALVGCDVTGLTKVDIAGKWKIVSKTIDGTTTNISAANEVYTFNADGTGSVTNGLISDPSFSYTIKGSKVAISGVSIAFTLQNSSTSYPYTATVSGTTLTFENNAGGAIGTSKFIFNKM